MGTYQVFLAWATKAMKAVAFAWNETAEARAERYAEHVLREAFAAAMASGYVATRDEFEADLRERLGVFFDAELFNSAIQGE